MDRLPARNQRLSLCILERHGVAVTVRDTAATEIDGACGQLAASTTPRNVVVPVGGSPSPPVTVSWRLTTPWDAAVCETKRGIRSCVRPWWWWTYWHRRQVERFWIWVAVMACSRRNLSLAPVRSWESTVA